jgi:hypothetical protein
MSLKTIFAHIGSLFASSHLAPLEKLVNQVSPHIGADLSAFMDTLPPAFASLENAAEHAIVLAKDILQISLTKTQAIAVAQNVFAAKFPDEVASAEALVTKLIG